MSDSRRGVFVISVVAEMTNTHPQTLRSWDRSGLLQPVRTAGGVRMYSQEDLATLRRILALSSQGFPAAAIRYILELEQEVARLRSENSRLRE